MTCWTVLKEKIRDWTVSSTKCTVGKRGMHTRKWVSNLDKVPVMTVISEEDCTTEVNIRDNSDAVTATLGLQWKSNQDAFIIPATAIPSDYPIAESYVLKMVPTVFDPLGLVSPFIVQGKIMLQEFWNWGYEWEEGDEDEMAYHIQNWFSQLPCLKEVKVPWCLRKP